jgi:hypothetical protein
MKNYFLILLPILFTLAGCSPGELYKCKGLPTKGAQFFSLHFISDKEGYLVGNIAHLEEGIGWSLARSSTYTSTDSTEGVVYKTTDAGKNWVKVNSNMGTRYAEAVINIEDNQLYILTRDDERYISSTIIKLSLTDYSNITSASFNNADKIWLNGHNISFTVNDSVARLYTLNARLNFIDTIEIADYVMEAGGNGRLNFALVSGFSRYLVEIENKHIKQLHLLRDSYTFTLLNDSMLFAVGPGTTYGNMNEPDAISYNINTGKITPINIFEHPVTVEKILVSGNNVAAIAGNRAWMGGYCYDLYYSTNQGKTWKKKLVNDSYMSIASLYGNTLYIYEGGAIMKKIELGD